MLSLSGQVLSVAGAGMFVEMMSWSPAPAVMARARAGGEHHGFLRDGAAAAAAAVSPLVLQKVPSEGS